MAKLRTINVDLNRQYRNDLNWNFQQIEVLTGISTAEIARVERESKERDDLLAGTDVQSIIDRIDTSANNADVKAQHASTQGDYAKAQGDYAKAQGDYARDKGDYANEKAVFADEAAANANLEATNLSQLKVDVVDATQAANSSADNANTQASFAQSQGDYAKQEADRIAGMDVGEITANIGDLQILQTENKNDLVSAINEVDTQVINHESRLSQLENGSVSVKADVSGLNREVAYLKLKQDASERIDGGTTFADDMNGNRFGFELNEAESQNVKIREGKMLMLEDVETTYSAVDEVVVNQAYSTAGNGGRKIVRLDNGWLVACVDKDTRTYFYVKKNAGSGWNQLCYIEVSNLNGQSSMVSTGNTISIIFTYGAYLRNITFDASTIPNVDINASANLNLLIAKNIVDQSQSAYGDLSLAIDPTNGHLHAAWASKNATYPNSFNIRYSKSTDGGVTWSAVEQITTQNVSGRNYQSPSVVIRNGVPFILFENYNGTHYYIMVARLVNNVWNINTNVHVGGSYFQAKPSAVVDKDGVIHVAWHGRSAVTPSINNIYYSKSVDGGVTWSAETMLAVKSDHFSINASVSTNKDGHIFITYSYNGGVKYLKSINGGDSWTPMTDFGNGTNPSTLDDNSLDFTKPITIRMGASNVLFSGEWSEVAEEPRTTATAVYDIPSTDYVGAFVKKQGAVTATAFLNDLPMDSDLLDDEYLFEKSLAMKELAKLRLELDRPDVLGGANDAVTRILGGRS